MKAIILLLAVSLCGAIPISNDNLQVFDEFHTTYANRDFKKMELVLADNFTPINEKGIIADTREGYIDYLKGWSRVFETKWNVEKVFARGDTVFSIEYDTDLFNDFFYKNRKRYYFTYLFSNHQIRSMRWDTLPGHAENEKSFEERFANFYLWVAKTNRNKLEFFKGSDSSSAKVIRELLTTYIAETNTTK